jgi:PAS domain S-box-containing protein
MVAYLPTSKENNEKKTEKLLLQKNAGIEGSKDAIFFWDSELRIISWNKGAEQLFGYTEQEALGKTADFLRTRYFGKTPEEVTRCTVKEGFWSGETVKTKKDGSEVFVLASATRIQNEHGDIVGYISINRDINDLKKTEKALQESEELFSKAFSLSPFALIITRYSDGLYIDVNDTFLKVFGYTRNEVIGHSSNEIHIYAKPDGRSEFLAAFKNGRVTDLELDLLTKTGKSIKGSLFSERMDVKGQDLILSTLVDITERKQMQEKLAEYTKNLEGLVEERTKKLELSSLYARNLIEASLDPLVTISAEGKITDVNKATELVTGCSRKELIDSDFSNYFVEPEKAKIGYKRVFTEGLVRDYPLAIRHKKGKITDVLYNATVYTNNAGEIQGVFAAARDITELKKAEEQAQEAAKKLKDSERLAAIGATAGMVGHDIRNPLQAIIGDLYLAKEELKEVPNDEGRQAMQESLEEIEKNVDYINKIVADLQDFARPLKPLVGEADLEIIINDLLSKNLLLENVRVRVKVESEARKVVADSDYIYRIMNNLVNNAVQAMPNGGKLTIHAYREANHVVITVKDTGVGIPESVKSKLFTPMFTTKARGQGFGLAVVKRMTEALGGSVSFESREGKGTTFKVCLLSPKR